MVMLYPEPNEEFGERRRSFLADMFRRYNKKVPPANILEEISHKLSEAGSLKEYRDVFSAYGIDLMPKTEKDVPFVKLYDVIRQALSGPGKKMETFCTSILHHLDCGLAECQALILAPTRLLAKKIAEVMEKVKLGDNFGQVKVHTCVGGEKCNLRKDRRVLSQGGCHVIVGTPGRLCTVLNRKLLRPDHIKMFVLDEVDEMLSLGLRNQVEEIFRFLPSKVQLALFSASFHPEALKIMRKLMLKPVSLLSKSRELVAREEGIKKFYVNVANEPRLKLRTLHHICESLDFGYCVIYVNTPEDAYNLSSDMGARGYKVSDTCTLLDQEYIDTQLQQFRSGSTNVLVTMPDYLVVRTFELQQVSLIINYFITKPCDNYLRLWRGGRFGRNGVVIDLITMNDVELADYDDMHGFCDVVVVEGESLKLR